MGAVSALHDNRLMALGRAYHADVDDGTQWVFWVRQGNSEKAIYFNNNFPQPITRFAEQLDAILSTGGLSEAAWERIPDGEYDKDVWARLRQ